MRQLRYKYGAWPSLEHTAPTSRHFLKEVPIELPRHSRRGGPGPVQTVAQRWVKCLVTIVIVIHFNWFWSFTQQNKFSSMKLGTSRYNE